MSEGLYAIVGVLIGGVLGWAGEYIRYRYTTRQRATYAAIRSVIALDRYVSKCALSLTESDPDYPDDQDPDDNWNLPEKVVIPEDVDWSSLSSDLAYRILVIPQRDAEAREGVNFTYGVAGGAAAKQILDEYFEEIGLDAAKCAVKLRKNFRLREHRYDKWNPVEVIRAYRKKRLDRAAS